MPLSPPSTWSRRTHTCGELGMTHVGESVVLNGWVHRRRDQGGLIFIDLRDRYGVTQVVINRDENSEAHETIGQTRSEFVLSISGGVRERPSGTSNDELSTGKIEIGRENQEKLKTSLFGKIWIE